MEQKTVETDDHQISNDSTASNVQRRTESAYRTNFVAKLEYPPSNPNLNSGGGEHCSGHQSPRQNVNSTSGRPHNSAVPNGGDPGDHYESHDRVGI